MNNKRIRWIRVTPVLMILFLAPAAYSAGLDHTDSIERGKYLVRVSGCNDCHTPGYLLSEGKTPEDLWLTGDNFGWHGPWGTTYASNLRLIVQDLNEDEWVTMAKTLKARPPMPWFNLNQMDDADLRAMYQYIYSLGPAGVTAPAYIPPGEEPSPPYALFPSPPAP